MILENQGPRLGPVDMTISRHRSSSHSSQQSWGGSTSGESLSGESSAPHSNNSSMMNGHTYYVNGHMNGHVTSEPETMLNGYHTPPPPPPSSSSYPHRTKGYPQHHHHFGGHTNGDSPQKVMPPSPPRRYSPSKHLPPRQLGTPPRQHVLDGQRLRANTMDSKMSGHNGTIQHSVSARDLSTSSSGGTNVARILEVHRNLAQTYTTHQPRSEPKHGDRICYDTLHQELQNDYRDEPPPMLPARKNRPVPVDHSRSAQNQNGGHYQGNHVRRRIDSDIDSCHSNSTSTPNSSTPSTPTSEAAAHGIPNGYATIRGKPSKSNLQTISENFGQLFSKANPKLRNGSSDDDQLSPTHTSTPLKASRPRSNSIGNFLGFASLMGTSTEDELDSDENNDDYGFLSPLFTSLHNSVNSTPHSSSTVAMHKAKSPTPAHRILPKKWRKSKLLTPSGAVTKTTSLWKPKGNCVWESVSGKTVTLTGTTLIHLTELERLVLQKLAHARLQALQLGCTIHIPKDGGSKRSKRSAFSLKRKTNNSDPKSGLVFGIPLCKCVSNDAELRRRKPFLQQRKDSLDLMSVAHHIGRKSSCSSVSGFGLQGLLGRSLSASPSRVTTPPPLEVVRSFSYNAGAISSDSLSESDSRHGSSNLLDALSLSSSAKLEAKLDRAWRDTRNSLNPHTLQVPYVVNSCFKHLETYGIRTLGIFRIGSSKKRTKQLREEFDSGKDLTLTDEHSPHDVAALLKEFFRDLPDPLLTRDLYGAFVATGKIKDIFKRHKALHDLIALLPVANRDTLWSLLHFLQLVVQHSADVVDDHGNQLPGNKMDAHNLATLFGPNVLHKAKGCEYEVETPERAEERKDVISVIQDMINSFDQFYQVSAEEYDEIMRAMHDSNPDATDYLLKKKSLVVGIEPDPETSVSSFLEESDSSSAQPSPSYCSEGEHAHSFTEGLAPSGGQVTTGIGHVTFGLSHPQPKRVNIRSAQAQPPVTPQVEMLQIPQFNISTVPNEWYSSDSRTPSPVSPRVSPSPKALKPATSDLHIRITPSSPQQPGYHERYSGAPTSPTGPARITLRSSRTKPKSRDQHQQQVTSEHRGQHLESSSIPHVCSTSVNQLTVPTRSSRSTPHRDSDSSSSSSYYPSSSRSATNSPKTPDTPDSPWTIDPARISSLYFKKQRDPPPPPQIAQMLPPKTAQVNKQEAESRTSSVQRPLGLRQDSSRSSISATNQGHRHEGHSNQGEGQRLPDNAPKWHSERWKHWEKLAKQNSEDFHEQETLV